MRGWGKQALRAGAAALPLLLGACQTLITPGGCEPGVGPAAAEPRLPHEPTMHALACDLDHLEKHIDWHGSIVAKVPDVWGQARLTVYREQFEQLMDPTLPANKLEFQAGLQGSLARSDQAFLAHAQALSFAAQPRPPVVGRVQSTKNAIAPATAPQSAQTVMVQGVADRTGAATPTKRTAPNVILAGQREEDPPPFAPIPPDNPANLLIDPENAIKRELVAGRTLSEAIGIEPSLMVAQKKRYLDFLNQLRRENEGDDTADSPGYSLNLVRVPVSILPGKRTDVGHGAEVTMTLTPVLGDDLLPVTFRNLVVNDLLHQLGYPLTQFLNDRDVAAVLTPKARDVILGLPVFNRIMAVLARHPDDPGTAQYYVDELLRTLTDAERARLPALADQLEPDERIAFLQLVRSALGGPNGKAAPPAADGGARVLVFNQAVRDADIDALKHKDGPRPVGPDKRVEAKARTLALKLTVPPLAFSPGLVNKTGFPTSQLIDVFGLSGCFEVAYRAELALRDAIERQGYAHLPDVQGFLQQEVFGAYRFLREPAAQPLWHRFCTPELVTAVRTRDLDRLQTLREEYRAHIAAITRSTPDVLAARPYNEPQQYGVTASLAWCILVDSALLTDRLIQDMKETATAKGKCLPGCEHWLPYYLPDPPPDARAAFNQYVCLRWPIHVFALDPYTQDQNVADVLSTRREIQLALAIAFTNGFISSRSLTRYTRRLEAEYETIALNRTQVGFGHGENVFGWRFYPRFQTPDTEGNLTVIARDLILGGPNRNALLRQRRLEPGPRECVAVVLMPSFVPYATLDVWGNWFGLANPKHKVLDHTQALHLSKTVQAIKTGGCGVRDACKYRDGDFERLLRRAEQLEARLPSQTMQFPVPILNTLGGFEMFSNGTTDLAPELYGWYGAPGVSVDTPTTLFLVGDHFSPLRTEVVIGNQNVTGKKMLSRQVMMVTVPKGVVPVIDKDGRRYAQAQVATPYGVTRELLIPLVGGAPPAVPAIPRAGPLAPNGPRPVIPYVPPDPPTPEAVPRALPAPAPLPTPAPIPSPAAPPADETWRPAAGTEPRRPPTVEIEPPKP